MNIEQMKKLAALIKVPSLGDYLYADHRAFQAALKDRDPLEAKWHGYTWDGRQPPLLSKETSYEGCAAWELDVATMRLTLRLWNGDAVDGYRLDLRCSWVYQIFETDTGLIQKLFKPLLLAHAESTAQADEDAYQAQLTKLRVKARYDAYLAQAQEETAP